MPITQFNLTRLVGRLQNKTGKVYTWKYIQEQSGVSRGTLFNIRDNVTSGINLETIDRLLAFFACEGMPIAPGDLFFVPTDDHEAGQ